MAAVTAVVARLLGDQREQPRRARLIRGWVPAWETPHAVAIIIYVKGT